MDFPPRLRFKLEKLKSSWRELFRAQEPSYGTAHRMCPNCRGLIARDAAVCPLCGASTRPARARQAVAAGRILGVIPVPSTATSALVAANIFLFVLTWYLTQSGSSADPTRSPADLEGEILVRLGAKHPLIFAGQWWRLVTAIFLHAGLLHIGFNLWCLLDLGPTVEQLFSTPKFIVTYLATGVAGFLLSLWWSPFGPSVGASGAVLGLIGALIGASFHHGHLGKEFRSQLVRWVIYIFAFGLLFRADNAAHLGGLVVGAGLGYFVPEGEPATRAGDRLWNFLAVLAVVVMAGAFALMALQLNRPLQ